MAKKKAVQRTCILDFKCNESHSKLHARLLGLFKEAVCEQIQPSCMEFNVRPYLAVGCE